MREEEEFEKCKKKKEEEKEVKVDRQKPFYSLTRQ